MADDIPAIAYFAFFAVIGLSTLFLVYNLGSSLTANILGRQEKTMTEKGDWWQQNWIFAAAFIVVVILGIIFLVTREKEKK